MHFIYPLSHTLISMLSPFVQPLEEPHGPKWVSIHLIFLDAICHINRSSTDATNANTKHHSFLGLVEYGL